MHVLITGAMGRIGQLFRNDYGHLYTLRLLDRHGPIPADPGQETVVVDLADLDTLRHAMKDMDAVIHLAAATDPRAPWDSVLENNISGTYNVFEAARQSGVPRVVFASSHWAGAYAVHDLGVAGPEMPMRPASYYGVSKAFGEILARYYADAFGLSIICLRIGSCHAAKDPEIERVRLARTLQRNNTWFYTARQDLGIWISDRDMTKLLHLALQTDIHYGVYNAASDNHPVVLDISRTKAELGYQPQDSVNDLIDIT